MRFGLHISIAESMDKAPQRAFDSKCECYQIFSRSPHGGQAKALDEKTIKAFRQNARQYPTGDFFIHSPYYINFASENNRVYYGSISAVRAELETADLLGARGVVTHLGSAKDLGVSAAKKKLVAGLCRIFAVPTKDKDAPATYKPFRAQLLLEITAGSGNIMGDTFEEIAYFIKETEKEVGPDVLGVCFDTAHAFASGYDLRTESAVRKTFRDFDKIAGLDRIKLVHINDSSAQLGSHIDRHANIGQGEIGQAGIAAILKELKPYDLNFVLETPPLRSDKDLELLKAVREKI